jgi:hypothetical protein
VTKASQEYKKERKLEIKTAETTTYEETATGEISNPNNEISVTYLFYELQRRCLVTEQLTGIQPVVLVAAPVPTPSDVNESFLIRHDWILKRALLDDSYQEAFDMIKDTQLSREIEVGVRKKAVERQLEALRETKEQLHTATRLRDRALAEIGEAVERLAATAVGAGAADTATTILTGGLGQLFTGGGGGLSQGLEEAARMQEEAAQEALARIDREMARLRTRLEASTGALEQTIAAYARVVREALWREQAILRLRVHIAENILHYMHTIWEYEVLDQRFFTLHDVSVPWIKGTMTEEGMELNISTAWAPDLASVADIENLLGFKGNYLIFPLKKDNALTKVMSAPYHSKLVDRSVLNQLMVQDRLSKQADSLLSAVGTDDHSVFTTLGLLADSWQVVTVPSGHLHIEALPGTKPVLEDFKLKHRHVDVLDALADVTIKEVDALRKLLRLLVGDLSDPEVEQGTVHISTGRDEGSSDAQPEP